jgi:GNAT superfamily N-acetyltransferase
VLEVLVAAEAAEPSESFVDLTEVELELRQPGMNLPQGSSAALHNGRIVGFATLYAPGPGTEWNVYLSGAVLPEYRRAGIGGSLLQSLIDQAKILRDRDFSDLPGVLKIWLQAGRTSAAALAAAADFTVRRYFFEMRAGLEEPLVDWAALATVNSPRLEGIEVRGWSADDDEVCGWPITRPSPTIGVRCRRPPSGGGICSPSPPSFVLTALGSPC